LSKQQKELPVDSAGRLRDISVVLGPGTPQWPGDTPYTCGWPSTITGGSSVNVSSINTSPHVGTHADAPLHVRDGWPGSHELSLDAFIGTATVVDVSELSGEISIDLLDQLSPETDIERLLLKTNRSIASSVFPDEWPCLGESCARTLLGRGLKLLGVDCPSVDERESKNLPVHQMLFAGNASILENLDLRRIPAGDYELIAFPLKIMALDAAPVRAVLRDRLR
jgi:arylformamidase